MGFFMKNSRYCKTLKSKVLKLGLLSFIDLYKAILPIARLAEPDGAVNESLFILLS